MISDLIDPAVLFLLRALRPAGTIPFSCGHGDRSSLRAEVLRAPVSHASRPAFSVRVIVFEMMPLNAPEKAPDNLAVGIKG